ncbi:hypothetical protein EDD90_10805 [Streptomyces sp. Ag109_O5-1]|uniref:hypothetical protein n=1 Tax=Streptomyces sp. Ag109_O5-1 TaxID=1938851 RepID=UPI000F515FB1|nr:hypothetical protein [Streptomyces sp. Ag109_O5-1]RPE27120.1 hypothetical protein EDD90_10805 [Streptomyces sp. Ag109_O5-1]
MTIPNLGPLEFVSGEWIVGDSTAPKSKYFKLDRNGLSYWVQGVRAETIPWSRFMNLGLSIQASRLSNSGTLARITDLALSLTGSSRHGGGEAYFTATLRSPYEDWNAHYTRAATKYGRREIRLAQAFFAQVVKCGRADKLGDPQWVAAAVEKIAGITAESRNIDGAVGEIVSS